MWKTRVIGKALANLSDVSTQLQIARIKLASTIKLTFAVIIISPLITTQSYAHSSSINFDETNSSRDLFNAYWAIMLTSKPVEAMTITPTGEWVVITPSQVYHSDDFNPGTLLAINYYRWYGQTIDVIAGAANGAMVVVTDAWNYMAGSVPYERELEDAIEKHKNAGRKINAISFTPNNDGWVIITDDQYDEKNAPSHLVAALKDAQLSKRKMRHVDISSDGRWLVVADDWFASNRLSDKFYSSLRQWQRQAKDISFLTLGKNDDYFLLSTKDFVPSNDAGRMEHGLLDASGNRTNIWQLMEDMDVPGIGMAWHDDKGFRYSRSYGVERKQTQNFVRYNSIFAPASLSKFMTALTLARLRDNGVFGPLNWGSDIDSLVSSMDGPLTAWADQAINLSNVNLVSLLSHTSGITNPYWLSYRRPIFWPNGRLATIGELVNGEFCRLDEACQTDRRYEFLTPSMRRFEYRNGNYNFAGFLAEHLTGVAFSDLAEQQVFAPLGMENSAFAWPLPNRLKSRLVYTYDEDGVEAKRLTAALPAGGMVTTPGDYMKALLVMLDTGKSAQGTQFLRPGTVREMLLDYTLPQDSNGNESERYGLGVYLTQNIVDESDGIFSHGGVLYKSARSSMWGMPSKDLGFVVMTNAAQGTAMAREMRTAFRCIVESQNTPDCQSRGLAQLSLPPGGIIPIRLQ